MPCEKRREILFRATSFLLSLQPPTAPQAKRQLTELPLPNAETTLPRSFHGLVSGHIFVIDPNPGFDVSSIVGVSISA